MFYLVYTITLLYFACPDVLSAVGETSYGMRVGFVGLDEVLTIILFIYLFIYLCLRCKVYSCLFNQIKTVF